MKIKSKQAKKSSLPTSHFSAVIGENGVNASGMRVKSMVRGGDPGYNHGGDGDTNYATYTRCGDPYKETRSEGFDKYDRTCRKCQNYSAVWTGSEYESCSDWVKR